jgi:chromosomal replication initiator protein
MSVRKGGISSDFGKQFREKYRNLDVLMMDDIQFVSKKPETQNELFHTFNDLTQAGKQIIFASDRAPSEIPDLEDRLRSRFEWGLIADIQQPDMETRVAILQKKALAQKVVIANDVLTYMAQRLATNIREMESMLNKVILLGKLYNKPITIELAQETFKDYSEPTEEAVGAEDVIDCTCKYFDVNKEDLLGKKRDKKIVEPRQICIYVISEMLPLPLTTIGEIMGGRDHTTVLHAKNKVSSLVGKDERFDKAITDIKNMICKK